MKFDKNEAFEDYYKLTSQLSNEKSIMKQLNVLQKLPDFFEKIYKQGYEDGLKEGKLKAFSTTQN